MKAYLLKYLSICALTFAALVSTQASAADEIYTSYFSNKAVGGYDTVAYFTEGKPVKGSDQYKVEYRGADWYFSSAENLELFKANMEKYTPEYGGYCAWAVGAQNQLASGDPLQWTVYKGKLYLNYDASVKKQWLADKDNLIQKADQNWPNVLNN